MRRMYSEQELTNVIKKVFEEELESGSLDELVSDAVDAYLVEHPVDITALEGQDIAPANVNATSGVYAPEIIESMSGYTGAIMTQTGWTIEKVYVGAVKNGNKVTFVCALNLTKTSEDADVFIDLAEITIPLAVYNKLYPTNVGDSSFLDNKVVKAFTAYNSAVDAYSYVAKRTGVKIGFIGYLNNLVLNTKYYWRYEVTFLLSDDIVPEE